MSISRRSFLKMAGLSTVAVAGTALFAGCSVASYLQIELDEKVRKEITKDVDPDSLEAANATINAYLAVINASLMLVPMFGVTSFDKKEVMAKINEALDKAAETKPDDVAEIRKWMDKFDIVTNKDGKIESTGFGYTKITVIVTIKDAAATQALSVALAAAV